MGLAWPAQNVFLVRIGNEYSSRECYHTETRLTVCVLELLGPFVVSVLCHLLRHNLVEGGVGGEGLKDAQGLDILSELVTHQ